MSYSSQKFPLSMEIKLKTFYIPEIEKSVIHNPIDIIFHNPFCNHKTSLAAKKPDAIFCQKMEVGKIGNCIFIHISCINPRPNK